MSQNVGTNKRRWKGDMDLRLVGLHIKDVLKQAVCYLWKLANPGRGSPSLGPQGPKISKYSKIYIYFLFCFVLF